MRLKVYDSLNPYIVKQLAGVKSKKILDVGCGVGRLGAVLRGNHNIVYGIEISGKAADKASKVLDKVIVADIEDIRLPFRQQEFDIIVMGDVLEHLKDPANALMGIKQYLKDNGLLVVSVPNVANWLVRLKLLFGIFDYEHKGILDDSHLRFFTLRTISRLISKSGFHIKAVDIYPSFPPFFMRANLLRPLAYWISCLRKSLFAFQFVIVAKKSLSRMPWQR